MVFNRHVILSEVEGPLYRPTPLRSSRNAPTKFLVGMPECVSADGKVHRSFDFVI
jgi:hypothetical protein